MAILKKTARAKKTFGGRAHICNVMGLPVNTPINDAKEDIRFAVTKKDVLKANPKDAASCGYSKALCRETGLDNIHVYRNTTLIAEKIGNKDVITRYRNPQDMRLILNKFDINAKMPVHEMTLKAPKGSYTLEAGEASRATYRAAIASGKHKVKPRGPIDTGHLAVLRPRLMSSEAVK
jgi:hypothetical protein